MRGEVGTVEVPHKLVRPRRFDMTVLLNGVTWRRVQIEVSADEGDAGTTPEWIPSPSLAGFGLPTPDHLVSLSMCCQIAQKIHASTDPHEPPEFVNDCARDVVDLLLLRPLTEMNEHPSLTEMRAAVEDVFAARAAEAQAMEGARRASGREIDCPSALGAELLQSRRIRRAADHFGRRCRAGQCLAGAHRERLSLNVSVKNPFPPRAVRPGSSSR